MSFFKCRNNSIETIQKSRKNIIFYFVFQTFLVLTFIVLLCWGVQYRLKFRPVNGDFQNYNPVHRFLSGQVIFRDFWDYLGIGHTLIGSATTVLFGGTFASSVIAFKFLSIFSLFLFIYVLADYTFFNSQTAICMSSISFILITGIVFLPFPIQRITNIFAQGYNSGVSARYLRAMILPLMLLTFRFLIFLYDKLSAKNQWLSHSICSLTVLGILAGIAFCWSNDFGISCYVCTVVMVFWVSLSRKRKFFRSVIKSIFVALIGLLTVFITISVLTHGNFTRWLQCTVGTSSYQAWYYISDKSLYFYNIDLYSTAIFQGCLTFFYMIIVFMQRGRRKVLLHYGMIGFVNMVCFCAANEYKLLSGGVLHQVSDAVLLLTLGYEVLYWILKFISSRTDLNIVRIFSICTLALYMITIPVLGINASQRAKVDKKSAPYIESLGGNVLSYASDLLNTSDFLQGKKFFSTYASAQEVVESFFKPSSNDYIIHVLGDDAREQYLQDYRNCEYPYSMTMNKNHIYWEYWLNYANWFFYRELYTNEHPVFYNTYAVYWEDNQPGETNIYTGPIDVEIQKEEPYTKLVVKTDASVSGWADVFIDYSVDKKDGVSSPFLFRKMVHLSVNTDDTHPLAYYKQTFLRDKSAEFIPVKVNNGYGELFLEAIPERDCILNIHDIKCDRILTAPGQYFQCSDLEIKNDTIQFSVENASEWPISLSQRSTLCFRGIEYPIKDISQDNNRWIITVIGEHTQLSKDSLSTQENIFYIK